MNFKNASDLRTSMQTSYTQLLDIDLTDGTPERDIFVEAPIEGQLLDMWSAIQYLFMLQAPFIYTDQILTEDLDIICRNYDVGTIPATYSTGELTYFTYTSPTEDVIITSSNGGKTSDGTKEYTVEGYYTIPVADIAAYYNTTRSRYEITVNIVANIAGPNGTAGAQTITEVSNSIPGITGCINFGAVTGGEAEGSLTDRLNLVRSKFKGRNLSSTSGLKLYVQNYSPSVSIVGSNDPLMLRSEGMGGSIDIYVKDQIIEGAQDIVTITSTGLSIDFLDPQYTTTSVILQNQPVDSLTLVIKNGITLDTSYYSLVKDVGVLSKSTRSRDSMTLTAAGITTLGYFSSGDVVEVRYNYNKLLTTIEDDLNSDINAYDNRDYLAREQTQIVIGIYSQIKLVTGAKISDVIASASLSIAAYMDTFSLSSSSRIELIEVLDLIKNTTGVDNINITTALLTPSDSRALTASGDVPIYTNEYPKLGDVNLVEWTY